METTLNPGFHIKASNVLVAEHAELSKAFEIFSFYEMLTLRVP